MITAQDIMNKTLEKRRAVLCEARALASEKMSANMMRRAALWCYAMPRAARRCRLCRMLATLPLRY